FNRSLLLPTGSTPMGTVSGRDRIVHVSGTRQAGVTSGPIAQLEFIAALGDTLATALAIENFAWLDGPVKVQTLDGEVTIKGSGGWFLFLPSGRLTLLPPQPNPATRSTQIIYETIEEGRTQLYVVDALGRC